MTGYVSLWVVFYHPLDFPAHVVVREQRVDSEIRAAPVGCLYDSLEEMRKDWVERELFWMDRDPFDDPAIVGVWV